VCCPPCCNPSTLKSGCNPAAILLPLATTLLQPCHYSCSSHVATLRYSANTLFHAARTLPPPAATHCKSAATLLEPCCNPAVPCNYPSLALPLPYSPLPLPHINFAATLLLSFTTVMHPATSLLQQCHNPAALFPASTLSLPWSPATTPQQLCSNSAATLLLSCRYHAAPCYYPTSTQPPTCCPLPLSYGNCAGTLLLSCCTMLQSYSTTSLLPPANLCCNPAAILLHLATNLIQPCHYPAACSHCPAATLLLLAIPLLPSVPLDPAASLMRPILQPCWTLLVWYYGVALSHFPAALSYYPAATLLLRFCNSAATFLLPWSVYS
jgi:hypothetical protein